MYFIDTIVYLFILIFKRSWLDKRVFSKKFVPVVMAASIALFFLNLAFAETDRPELLTRTFDHKYLVKYLGPYNFTVYDGVKTIQNNQQKALASEDDLTRVLNYETKIQNQTLNIMVLLRRKYHKNTFGKFSNIFN